MSDTLSVHRIVSVRRPNPDVFTVTCACGWAGTAPRHAQAMAEHANHVEMEASDNPAPRSRDTKRELLNGPRSFAHRIARDQIIGQVDAAIAGMSKVERDAWLEAIAVHINTKRST